MSVQALPGGLSIPLGPHVLFTLNSGAPAATTGTLDAANEAVIFVGQIVTSDGASHTIDTTGSSSLQWRTATVTFANAGTTVKVGLAAVDTTNGPPARAAHASDVISFDVSKSMTGGGGGVTTGAWQTHVPDAGTKTVANGDFIAMAVQMTARGGADSVQVSLGSVGASVQRPTVTAYLGGSYVAGTGVPLAVIVFSDGALGYFYGSDVGSTINTRTWNSGSATKEYGQLYQFPFPVRISGLYGWIDPDADCDVVLYSDPLGTPVAEKTISFDANATAVAAARRFSVMFPAAYDLAANTPIGAVFKPGASNVSAYYKTLNNAAHRVADVWGTSGYGISRASGAFGNANVSLDHYYIGLLAGGFEAGGSGGLVAPLFGGGVV